MVSCPRAYTRSAPEKELVQQQACRQARLSPEGEKSGNSRDPSGHTRGADTEKRNAALQGVTTRVLVHRRSGRA
jgi:hypothetical protein